MTTILQLCTDLLEELGQFDVPAALVGSDDPTAKQLLALANLTARDICRRREWEALRSTHTFSTADGTESYAAGIPDDFGRFENLTFWDRTNLRRVRGPVTAAEWERLKSGLGVAAGISKYFRIIGGAFYIYPTPTAIETIAFQYQSSEFITGKTKFDDDTDEFLPPEQLLSLGIKWRYLHAKGFEHAQEKADYFEALGFEAAADGAAPPIDFGRRAVLSSANIPETGIGS